MPVLIFFATIGDISLGTIQMIFVQGALGGNRFYESADLDIFAIRTDYTESGYSPVQPYRCHRGFNSGDFYQYIYGEEAVHIEAQGAFGGVAVSLSIVKRKAAPQHLGMVNRFPPAHVLLVWNVRLVHEGSFPIRPFRDIRGYLDSIRLLDKGR